MGAEGSNVSESQINEHFKQYNYENDIFNIDCNVHQNKGMNNMFIHWMLILIRQCLQNLFLL